MHQAASIFISNLKKCSSVHHSDNFPFLRGGVRRGVGRGVEEKQLPPWAVSGLGLSLTLHSKSWHTIHSNQPQCRGWSNSSRTTESNKSLPLGRHTLTGWRRPPLGLHGRTATAHVPISTVSASMHSTTLCTLLPACGSPLCTHSTARNPYMRCGSGKLRVVLHAINDACESILAVHFQFFCLFCFDSFEEKSQCQMNLNWFRLLHTRATTDCYTSPTGRKKKKIEEKIQKEATLLVAQYPKTKVWTQCPHNLRQLEFSFHNCPSPWLLALGNFCSCWHQSNRTNNNDKNRQECRPCLFSTAEALWQWHASLRGAEKILQRCHRPFCYRNAWMESHAYFLSSWFLPLQLVHHIRTVCMDSQPITYIVVQLSPLDQM